MSLSHLKELWKLAELAQLKQDPLSRKTLLASALFPEATEQLHRYLSFKAVPGIINPYRADNEPTSKDLVLGFQGRVSQPIGISESDLNRHIVVVGTTGAGKTNWLNFFASQLLTAGKNVIWLDLKNEARHLVRMFPELGVFRIEDFRWNPLEVPKGVSPKRWLNVFASVYAHAFSILHASEGAILQYVDDLYQRFGVYDGSDKFPSLFDLVDYLNQLPVRPWSDQARYLSRTQNRIDTICRVLGDTISVSKGFDINELLNHSWALEIGSLKPDVQSFVAEALLMTIFNYRIANGVRNNGVKNVIIFDDGKRIWDRNKELRPAEGIPTITDIISQVREFGVSVIVADQDPQMLSQSLLDNAGTKICMSLGSGRAVSEMATAMGLSTEQRDFIYRFQPGQACVKSVGRDPFLMVIPGFPVQKLVTDQDIKDRLVEAEESLRFEPRAQLNQKQAVGDVARRFRGYSGNSGHIEPTSVEKQDIPLVQPEEKRGGNNSKVSEQGKKLLLDIVSHPTSGVSTRYKRLGMSVGKGSALVKSLVATRMITSDSVSTGHGRIQFLQLTDEGIAVLRTAGHPVEKKRAGGPEHEYWKYKVAETLGDRGFSVTIEKHIGHGQSVDVEARKGDDILAVEIETGKSDDESNLKKLIEAGYKDISMVFTKTPVPQLQATPRAIGVKVRSISVARLDKVLLRQ